MNIGTRPVAVGPIVFGAGSFQVIAGPCSVETEEQFRRTAQQVRRSGATLLRGGIYKLRTDPKSFQGLGLDALGFVSRTARESGLPFVTEVTDPRQIEVLEPFVDLFQVGTRNMHNYALLKELGRSKRPVLLKRGFAALVEEWLLAARYVTDGGNPNVILCERGIRTFEKVTRNTLDLASVTWIKKHSEFPIIVDPSHATGIRDLVAPMALASIAAGADGLLIETHPDPATALSDGPQALDFPAFDGLMSRIRELTSFLGRPLQVMT
jgi:3-deoxy-7-phosphoheptulonate synthase